MQTPKKVATIGAGMAGAACALRLSKAGYTVKLFEKSRGIGGRLATRRTLQGFQLDHGAQFFTVRTDDFSGFVEQQEAISAWPAKQYSDIVSISSDDWQVGSPRMNSFLKPVLADQDIALQATVTSINPVDKGWQLSGEGFEDNTRFDAVCITAPAPQVRQLTSFSSHMQAELSKVAMEPCWALLTAFDTPLNVSFDVWSDKTAETFSWIARNSSKPGRPRDPDCWVAHASPSWSTRNLELEKEEAAAKLIHALEATLDTSLPTPIYCSAHRWRYARVSQPLGQPCLLDETGSVVAAGDWCLGPRVESAFTSGLAAADTLIKHLSEV